MPSNLPDFNDRQSVLAFARHHLQVTLSSPEEKPEDWKELSEGFLIGVNETLEQYGHDQTDLEHLLPTVTNDPELITYKQVMEAAHV